MSIALRRPPGAPARTGGDHRVPGRRGPVPRRAARGRGALVAWGFLLPALAAFSLFKFWPTVVGFLQSFQNVRPYLGNEWIGLTNFERMLTDDRLWDAVGHTVLDAVVTVTVAMVLGFFLALLLEGPARRLAVARTAVFLPVVTSAVAAAQLFNILMYPTSDGILNRLLSVVGIGPLGFLQDSGQSLASVMLVQIWQLAPYDMVLFVAGLATIDSTLYEQAAIDGAGFWARLRAVTLPALRPVTSVILTLGIVRGLRVFTEVHVLTGGGPSGSSETVITYSYKRGLVDNDIGYASAISVALLVFTVALAVLNLWWSARRERS